jgi:hypothetical protein
LPVIPAARARTWISTPFPTGPEGRYYLREEPLPAPQPKVLEAAQLPRN